jgi:two-component system C4-dicarboxylate transport sensor histidine kinase DctB
MKNKGNGSRSARSSWYPGGIADDRRVPYLAALAGLLAILIWVALVLVTYSTALENSVEQLRRTSLQRLDFLTAVTGQTLQKHESMPYLLSQQGELIDLLEHPNEASHVRSVNEYLKRVQGKTGPLVVYLLNDKGTALASSNWNEPGSFIGQDYSFRPYFLQAMQGRPGRFYGVGTTTNEPGYFLSYPLFSRSYGRPATGAAVQAPIGAVAVKISLVDLEQAWSEGADAVALADADGVVFLSSSSSRRYRTLAPLAADVQTRLLQTRQYGDATLQTLPIRPLLPTWGSKIPSGAHTGLIRFAGEGDTSPKLMQTAEVGPLSWKLLLFSNAEATFAAARNVAVATALALALVVLLIFTLWLRRKRLQERQAARIALGRINEELEARIAERTQTLLNANADMEAKLSELSEAERMLRATQDQAIQGGKLAVLGQMSAGIVHEIAEPLTAMSLLSENGVKLLSINEFDEAAGNMSEISLLCRKVGSIVGQLKGFAHKSVETFEPVLMDRVIADAARMVRREAENAGIELDLQPQVSSIWVSGNSIRLEQVLLNLFRNSMDAVKDSARKCISIRMELNELHVIMRVRDTGSGISAQAHKRLFEPFFTTKGPGHGLGLGLAISASIVHAMRGDLHAANHPEGGAVFTLILPLAPAHPEGETI